MVAKSAITLLALAHPRMLATSVTLPLEIIRAAAHASPPPTRSEVSIRLVGKQAETLPLADGLSMPVTEDDGECVPDILLIPAIWRHPRWVLHHHPWQLDVIRRCIDGGSWVCSVGAGSFLLAEAGVLNQGVATTHWHWFDTFETTYPTVSLRRDQLITQQGRIFCVGSVNSIADLMVYLAGQLFSRATATAIENQFSPEIRRRFSPHELGFASETHQDEKILDVQWLIRSDIKQAIDLPELANSCGVTVRTLNRRFRAATGMTPVYYQHTIRAEEAKNLLLNTNLPVAEVGWQVGFRDASVFSRRFKALAGVTPRQYRIAVRGKIFALDPAPNLLNPSSSLQNRLQR